MKVLMFRTNPCTSDPRVYSEATSLLKAGHEVTVIAWDREKQNPARQNWDGIEVIRLRMRLSTRYGFASWLWNGFNLLLWQWQAYRQALALNKEKHFDVIHCPDLDTLAIGTGLKRKLKIPLIYDAYEIYGYMVADAVPRWGVNMLLWLEKRLVRRVDRMITDGEGQERYFASVTDKPITIIMNCKPLQSLEYQPPDRGENITLVYIGLLWKSRMLLELVEAVRDLANVRCIIGGAGLPAYVKALEDKCSMTSNVTFVGRVPFDDVIPTVKKAHAVVCLIDPDDLNNRLGMANKIGEAMVCGRPVICTRGTYCGEITEREGSGLVIEKSVEALRGAIIKLRDNPGLRERLGRNALQAAITTYNWQKEEEKLLALYHSLQIRCAMNQSKSRPDNSGEDLT
jgi:glycosyltransferase involved in cell wall biosynthesis